MIEVSCLSKRYASTHAIRDLSFSIKKGEIVGFLGPNGAGKTTTLNILTGYLSPTSGTVRINGLDIMDSPLETKSRIGYLPETPPLYHDMTVKEYLNFMYELKRVTLPREGHISEICRLVKIDDVYGRVIAHLSKGYKQRVGIAQALLGNPPVLILDEPTVGLDPKQMIEIRKLIETLGKNRTVILSSHILSEIQAVCNRIIIIHQGNIVADGTKETIANSIDGGNVIVARIAGMPGEISKALKNVKLVRKVTDMGEKEPGAHDYHIEVQYGVDARYAIFEQLALKKMPILNLLASDLTLEDVFLRLTSYSEGGDEG